MRGRGDAEEIGEYGPLELWPCRNNLTNKVQKPTTALLRGCYRKLATTTAARSL